MNSKSVAGKGAVVVTGASTGIGKATALYLDKAGYQVFAGVRKQADADALKEVSTAGLTPVMLDVADQTSIAQAARVVDEMMGAQGLAGLVNNAGIATSCPIEFFPLDQASTLLNVNLIGQIAVTQAFLPLIRKGKGRIVNIGSIGGIQPFPSGGLYNASKAGLHALTDALRMELSEWGIPVILVVPGNISTPVWEKTGGQVKDLMAGIPQRGQELYGPLMADLGQALGKMAGKGTPAVAVARAVRDGLTAKKPKARYIVGTDASLQVIMAKFIGSKIRDSLVLRSLRKSPVKG